MKAKYTCSNSTSCIWSFTSTSLLILQLAVV